AGVKVVREQAVAVAVCRPPRLLVCRVCLGLCLYRLLFGLLFGRPCLYLYSRRLYRPLYFYRLGPVDLFYPDLFCLRFDPSFCRLCPLAVADFSPTCLLPTLNYSGFHHHLGCCEAHFYNSLQLRYISFRSYTYCPNCERPCVFRLCQLQFVQLV